MGATFGGASQTVFGSQGPANFLSKLTAGVAILFLITSVSLAQMSKQASESGSVLDKTELPVETSTLPVADDAAAGESKTEK